jgi:hypothetical protein
MQTTLAGARRTGQIVAIRRFLIARSSQRGSYAVALAILVVGLVWAGVPAGTLLLGGLVLMCPLMMVFMMRGMHGDGHLAHAWQRTLHDNHMRPDQHRDDLPGLGRATHDRDV